MNFKYKFFISGRTRNKDNIFKICDIFEELNISHYCFLKNEESHKEAGLDLHSDNLADTFEALNLENVMLLENMMKQILYILYLKRFLKKKMNLRSF